jgi:hypothetical protein
LLVGNVDVGFQFDHSGAASLPVATALPFFLSFFLSYWDSFAVGLYRGE